MGVPCQAAEHELGSVRAAVGGGRRADGRPPGLHDGRLTVPAAELPDLRWMAVVSLVETVSLVVLLANLALCTFHRSRRCWGLCMDSPTWPRSPRRSCSRSTPGHGSSPSSRRS